MTTTTNGILQRLWSKDDRPMYLLNEATLYHNLVNMQEALGKLYGNVQVAYSLKTNYLADVCQIVKQFGGLAEVVSPYERRYAMELGFEPEEIIYNGVIPSPHEKMTAALHGGRVNVDNLDEFDAIEKIAAYEQIVIDLGVRVTFDPGNGLKSRFGVDINGSEFRELMDRFEKSSCIRFGGFHCHIGSARPVRYWKKKAEVMFQLASEYGAGYVDLGGGMFGPMTKELASQFSGYASSFDEYAEAICIPAKERFPDESVKLYVEPGTALVGNTMKMAVTVTNIKEVGGITYVTTNGVSNQMGVICDMKYLPYTIVRMTDTEPVECREAIVAGATCLEYDYLRKGFNGSIAVGDRIVFENVGAYSISSSRQFIVPRPMVVSEVTGELLRREEGWSDMFGCYTEKILEPSK